MSSLMGWLMFFEILRKLYSRIFLIENKCVDSRRDSRSRVCFRIETYLVKEDETATYRLQIIESKINEGNLKRSDKHNINTCIIIILPSVSHS